MNPADPEVSELVTPSPFTRIPGREAQLTTHIATLCGKDPALARGFALAVLGAADTAPARGRGLVASLPNEVKIGKELNLGPKNEGRHPSGGRVDWVISGTGFCVLIEVKIGAGVAPTQLERYLAYDGFKDKHTVGGLILLTRDHLVPPPTVWQHKRWRGQISWDELVPQLQKVSATSAAVQQEWSTLLAELVRPGDLADSPVQWALKGLTPGKRNTRILGAVADSACQTVERGLALRKGWTKIDGLCSHRPGERRRAVLHNGKTARIDLFIPPASPFSVIWIELAGGRRPLELTTSATITHRRLSRAKTRKATLNRLKQAGFTIDGNTCRVTDRIAPQAGAVPADAPATVVRSVLRTRLTALVESGVLDVHAR